MAKRRNYSDSWIIWTSPLAPTGGIRAPQPTHYFLCRYCVISRHQVTQSRQCSRTDLRCEIKLARCERIPIKSNRLSDMSQMPV